MAHAVNRITREPPLIFPPPRPSPTLPATFIFIHGYNDRASSFNVEPPNRKAMAHYIYRYPTLRHVKIIVPEALPCIHPAIQGHTWYNIPKPLPDKGNIETFEHDLDTKTAEEWGSNEDEMNVSMDYFEELIQSEVEAGTPAHRIVLMGYSQGGGIVALFLLTRKLASELGAVISHAGFSITPMKSIYRMQKENKLAGSWSKKTKFFMLHGAEDMFVQREIFQVWKTRLEMFKERGNGIKEMESSLVENEKHAITINLWPHVAQILAEVIPAGLAQSSHKL